MMIFTNADYQMYIGSSHADSIKIAQLMQLSSLTQDFFRLSS